MSNVVSKVFWAPLNTLYIIGFKTILFVIQVLFRCKVELNTTDKTKDVLYVTKQDRCYSFVREHINNPNELVKAYKYVNNKGYEFIGYYTLEQTANFLGEIIALDTK